MNMPLFAYTISGLFILGGLLAGLAGVIEYGRMR